MKKEIKIRKSTLCKIISNLYLELEEVEKGYGLDIEKRGLIFEEISTFLKIYNEILEEEKSLY
nr:hypothetical protein [Fusobacterium gastrosuis]